MLQTGVQNTACACFLILEFVVYVYTQINISNFPFSLCSKKCPCFEAVLTRTIKIPEKLKDQCWVFKAIGMLLIQKILQISRNMGTLEKYGDHPVIIFTLFSCSVLQ
jgi:hypothetical protein